MYLVRHAMVVIDMNVPSNEWRLSADGRVAAARLVLRELPVRTSSEPKAVETAVAAGWTAMVDPLLREVERPWIGDDYERWVERYLGGEELDGWEPRETALARLHEALDGFDGIAVTHGLAISLYVGLTFDEWRAMPFPAVIEC
jgi:2,3-bisphosphoglycerate-dependent phosphoglycerate mutase